MLRFPMVSYLVTNLNRVLKKGEPWVWRPAQQAAHDGPKAVFNREGMVLHRIEYGKQLILHTDFSSRGLGVVLGQLDDDGNE